MNATTEIGDLSTLFRADATNAERATAMRAFGTAARTRLQTAASSVGQSRDVLAERSAQLLSELTVRLPIRTAETLRRQFGDDVETQSQHVITEAGRLAGLLWTAAAAVPGPPPVVHTIKVILHSAIEIRMIGELYAVHGEADRDETWLATVLLAWASAEPVTPGMSVAASPPTVVAKIRLSVTELIGNESRVAALASRGRAGTNMMLRNGKRLHRRMRLHPTMWAQPSGKAIGTVVREAIAGVAADKLAGRIPQALVNVARDRMTPSMSSASDEPPCPVPNLSPREALAQAWALHQQASTAASRTSILDPTATRLGAAVTAQEWHLQTLTRQLRQTRPAVPAQPDGQAASDAGRLVWNAEDAIDAVEDIGARSRRLPSWSTRRRAALAYLTTALVVSGLPAVFIVDSSGLRRFALLLAQSLVLPWLSLVAGAIAIGGLFRPWLGGPVPRHPLIGTWIVVAVHVGLGVLATVLGAFV